MIRKQLFLSLFLLFCTFHATSQPNPGELFREYTWLPEMVSEQGKFLRVGGKLDYIQNPAHYPVDRHFDGYIPLEKFVDLQFASKAEVLVEKIASHDDTRGLRISWNGNPFHTFPVSDSIPSPESAYMHHTNPVVEIPLDELSNGMENAFRLEVDTAQRWGWPQHLIYAVMLRVYYSTDSLNEFTMHQIEIQDSNAVSVKLALTGHDGPIRKTDYLGYYTGLNFEGDGKYRQWHYRFLRGEIQHHLGSTTTYPYTYNWDTGWVPDQTEEIRLAARITFHNGLIYFTEARKITLPARPFHVYLAKPYDQPRNW